MRKCLVGIGLVSLMGLQAYGQDAKDAKAEPATEPAVAAAPTPAPAPKSTTATVIRMRLDGMGESVKTTYGTTDAAGGTVAQAPKTDLFNSGIRVAPKSDITIINKLGDATVQLRLNPTFNAWTSQDSSMLPSGNGAFAGIVDQFWIEQPLFTDGLKLKAGKLDYPIYAGIERILATSYDYYIGSYFNGMVTPDPVGASIAYTVAKQKFELQFDNGVPSATKLINPTNAASNPYAQTAPAPITTSVGSGLVNQNFTTNGGWAMGLGYFGDLDWVKPVVTVSKIQYALNTNPANSAITDAKGNSQVNHYNGKGMNIISVGGTFNFAGASLMAEYDNLTAETYKYDYTTAAVPATTTTAAVAAVTSAGTMPKVTLNTLVLDLRYPIGTWTPFLKVTSDMQKVGSKKDLEQTGVSLGVWYAVTPTGRLDLAYNNVSQVQEPGSYAYGNKTKVTKTTTDYILGASLKI